MTKKTKCEDCVCLSKGEKLYAGTVVPLFISFVTYMLIGIPIIGI